MEKFYIVTETEKLYKTEKVYESKELALLNKAVEVMKTEHGIKPTSGTLTDAESNKKEYTLIEKYKNQFKNIKIITI